jgi:hypothetical protein
VGNTLIVKKIQWGKFSGRMFLSFLHIYYFQALQDAASVIKSKYNKTLVEASGGITEDTLVDYLLPGSMCFFVSVYCDVRQNIYISYKMIGSPWFSIRKSMKS